MQFRWIIFFLDLNIKCMYILSMVSQNRRYKEHQDTFDSQFFFLKIQTQCKTNQEEDTMQ